MAMPADSCCEKKPFLFVLQIAVQQGEKAPVRGFETVEHQVVLDGVPPPRRGGNS